MSDSSEHETAPAEGSKPGWFRRNLPILVVGVAAFLGVRFYQLRGAANGDAPGLAGMDVTSGEMMTLASADERPTLVYFWATWCGVCNAVDPNVDRVARDHRVLTVAVQSGTAPEIAAWMAERNLTMPTIADPQARFARAYGVRAFPTSFWVDADGTIRHREVGYTTTAGLLARLFFAEHL